MNTSELLEQAKKDLQEQGQCAPTLTVEFVDDGKEPSQASFGLDYFPGILMFQRMVMHTTGHRAAALYPGRTIAHVCFLLHIWAVKRPHESVPSVPPSMLPDGFEALVMQTLNVARGQGEEMPIVTEQTEYAAEIIRTSAGFDFLPLDEKVALSPLESFLEGFACEQSDAEEAGPSKKDKKSKKGKKKAKKTEKAGKGHDVQTTQ